MLSATLLAVILANTGASSWYFTLRDMKFGFANLGLNLSVGEWAADGLLVIFFFVVGLELKEEFTVGSLRDPRKAIVPIAATFGGAIAPALVDLTINGLSGSGNMEGWAVPTATDIAFVVAVLAVVGKHLPPQIRIFLLTLAVVDDLIAIIIIAVVFSTDISLLWLFLTLIPLALFGLAAQKGIRSGWILVPLAVLTWGFLHASGVHATVAGVALGFTVPAIATKKTRVAVKEEADGTIEYDSMAAYFADRWCVRDPGCGPDVRFLLRRRRGRRLGWPHVGARRARDPGCSVRPASWKAVRDHRRNVHRHPLPGNEAGSDHLVRHAWDGIRRWYWLHGRPAGW